MKNYIILFVLLITNLFWISINYGQNSIASVYSNPNEILRIPNGDIILITLLNPSIDELIKFYKSDHKYNDRVIKAIGFVAKRNDVEGIRLLNSIIASDSHIRSKVEAINALLRIGGKPLDSMLEMIFSTNDFELHKCLRFSWMLDDIEDLCTIEDHFDKVVEEHPDWKISHVIKTTYLPKIKIAIEVLNKKELYKSEKLLTDLIELKLNGLFIEPGGTAVLWANKMFFENTTIGKDKLYEYFLTQKQSTLQFCENTTTFCGVGKITESLLFYLHQLGYELSEREKNWLMHTYTAFPSGYMLNVFSSSEELLKYYDFRSKYPYHKPYNGCH